MKKSIILALLLIAARVEASQEVLVKFTQEGMKVKAQLLSTMVDGNSSIEQLPLNEWVLVKTDKKQSQKLLSIKNNPMIAHVQPNYKLSLLNKYKNQEAALKLAEMGFEEDPFAQPKPDNPAIPGPVVPVMGGADPEFSNQWGMNDNNVHEAWKKAKGDKIVVAVIDTGVDYTHEDLVENLWRNTKEIPDNNIDDDNNGFVDDIVGWDFASNDNKPYDFKVSLMELLFGGGNPGHGTHCAGNVAARGENGKGITGVAPHAQIMVIRFLTEKGSGTTADAIKSIKYAVDNGAKVLSNSWGSEGEDPQDQANNQALRDSVTYAQNNNVLFIAAAGNGRVDQAQQKAIGYDNDSDSKPSYPASYDMENIISVAATDSSDNKGEFSNFGKRTVDIGAPGVDVYSTISGGGYSNIVADLTTFGMPKVTWDGTSMATPHVAGAAALYWSKNPGMTWKQVKDAIMSSATPISSLNGKVVTNGKLNTQALMNK